MKLSDLLQDLALGDLQSSSVVEMGGYQILPQHLPKVIQATNQGLDYLYSIFPLKENQVTIQILPGISRYYLDSEYALSNTESDSKLRYILDTLEQPFTDDVLNIEQVFTDTGLELNINDNFAINGVFTPEYNCIQTTDGSQQFKYLTVVYKAKHKKIPLDAQLDSKLTINLPASYNGALQSFIASTIFNSLGGADNIQAGGLYYGKFKAIIEDLKAQGVGYKSTLGINIKPTLGGWL